jgi:hypothetical protein
MNSSSWGTGSGAFFLAALIACLMTACASSQVEKAFGGGLLKADTQKAITEYCQSCHIHRNFDGEKHLAAVGSKYNSEPYKTADGCQTCHSYTKDFWGDEFRATYFPEGKLTGEPSNAKK